MLTVKTVQVETRICYHSTGNDLTTIQLQNRKDGRRVDLKIWSCLPLSMGEVRDVINAELGDRWQWRQLNSFAEFSPF